MSIRLILTEQYCKLPVLVDSKTCSGKVYIVTGSNNGLGLETARHLVGSSASRVILAVRNLTAGETAKADIERTTGHKGVVEVWHLDLTSVSSVKSFVSKAEKDLDRIDGLVQNAGVWLDNWTVTNGGMETCMTVNVINTLLLGVLMMPKLTESASKHNITPRVVFVVSGLGFVPPARKEFIKGGKTEIFEGLNNQKDQLMSQRYALTKLVEIYSVRALAEAYPLEKNNVIINMVSPGICSTGLARDVNRSTRVFRAVVHAVFARTGEEGSRTILHGLLESKPTHGKHLSGCEIKDDWVPAWMTDAEGQQTQKQIWKELNDLFKSA